MPLTRLPVLAAAAVLLWIPGAAGASGPPFELAVKKDRFLGSSRGTLVFDRDGIAYRTTDRKDARHWPFQDLKQVQVLSPTRITILTFEDQGWLRLGADRSFDFELTGGPVSPELVGFLLDRIARPVVTAVMPPPAGEPLQRVAVKHQRRLRSSEGALVLYDGGLCYQADRDDAARHWRFGDIYAVLRLDRYRLQVIAYEGGSGGTRPFTFELKEDLPERFYDSLWQGVNRPASTR